MGFLSFYLLNYFLFLPLDESKEISCFLGPKKQTPSLDHTTSVIGEGEDYFLSLFNKPKKFISQSGHVQKIYKHFSTILEEVGQATSRYALYLDYGIASVWVGPINE